MTKKARAKHRKNPNRAEVVNRRAKRKAESAARHAATVYTCVHCATQFGPRTKRLPAHPPKYCSTRCASAYRLREARAAGLCWECRQPSETLRCEGCTAKRCERERRARKAKANAS